ncbi:hypothetical protein CHS0354_042087 [Potamilus streckersoni]|uniref:Lipase domain-containing protein n=1 Tax=Potamilus streckersoni TaxID=2493646 RepID=A0AAE0WHT2_9BIVA|nr:hypothetical protein CHS0354_042087 [Potamilus streckersoni]
MNTWRKRKKCGHEFAVSENVTSLPSQTKIFTEKSSTASVGHFNSTWTSKPSTTTGSTTTTVNPMINKTVCYNIVGCFDNYPPFDNADYDLPMSPEEVGTQFLLFTRRNLAMNETQFISYTDISNITNSYFDATKKTKFIIHGFSNSITTEWIYEMKDELLKTVRTWQEIFHKGDQSVI